MSFIRMYSRQNNVWIYTILLIFVSFATSVYCHESNNKILEELEEDVKEIKDGHDTIKMSIGVLQDYLLEEVSELSNVDELPEHSASELEPEDTETNLEVKRFVDRLDKLEKNIEVIENYIHDERETDVFLKGLRGDIGKAFDEDMLTVKNLASNMKKELNSYFVNVDHDLKAVEDFANSRNVIIGGVIYYDGIGSSCTLSFDVCRVKDSECRDGKCQCKPGLSHDSLQEKCVDVCADGYGNMYQTVHNYIIRGYNNATMNETSLNDCKQRCETDDSFECRSFDYFPRWNACYLSEMVKMDVEEEAWEYNSVGIHFQRDCIVDKQ